MGAPPRGLVLAGAGLLLLSLFLPWSHQFSPSFLARYAADPVLRGIPHDPDAWQLYTTADVLMALLAGALAATSVRGRRNVRAGLLAPVAVATAFAVHALAVPPTNGANIFDPTRAGYVVPGAGAGPGETVALLALAAGGGGLLLSLRRS